MSDSRAIDLHKASGAIFENRGSLHSLWQTIAENFYVQRANFTRVHNLGDELAENLMSSYPLIAHRELMGIMGSMLRFGDWFKLGVEDWEPNIRAKRWLEMSTKTQRKAMYSHSAGFNKATKSGDGDFTAFGQAVLSVEMNKYRNGLLYRNWHLKDVGWKENEEGQISHIVRKWKPYAIDLVRMFPKTVSNKTKEIADRTPYTRIDCMHHITPSDIYGDDKEYPWVSTYTEVQENVVLEEEGLHNKMYVIPRWQTISGSQYAYSPATVAALPDSRLIQAMTFTLLEAGEKSVNPPMLIKEGAIRSDLQVYAGGVTFTDDVDEEGQVIRELYRDPSNIPLGFSMQADIKEQINQAFYLNKLSLPDTRQMTAFEVNERMQEFVRQTLPLFEPMEQEYNGQLCEITFDLMLKNGDFGAELDIPRELRGEKIDFIFETPISEATDKKKGQQFIQAMEMLSIAAQAEPSTRHDLNINKAFRDALSGIQISAEWMTDEKEAEQAAMIEEVQQAAAAQAQ